MTTFNWTGSVQTYTVPAGVTQIQVDLYGAGAGAATGETPGTAGKGAHVSTLLTVTPGQVLDVYVGGGGR